MVQEIQLTEKPQRTFVLRFETGEEVASTLLDFAERRDVRAAELTGIGALSDVVLGFFDLDRRAYHENPVKEQVEVVTLVGNLAAKDGKAKLHAHVVVGKRDGTALGGHLVKGHVRPTLEIIVTDSPAHLQRRTDPETGLALLDLKESA